MQQIKPAISVIIPCYNANDFLPKLVACFAQQTFNNFELLLVNDGDVSQISIMEQLQKINGKIRIIHKENGGVSSARNAGIDAALGEWIVFTDQDDEVKPFYLQSLYDVVTKNNADIAIGGFTQIYLQEKRTCEYFIESENDNIYSKKEVFEMLNRLCYGSIWNKIYNTDFLRKSQCKFLSTSYYEDIIFITTLFVATNLKIVLLKDCGYIWLMRDSQSVSSKYKQSFTSDVLKMISLHRQLFEQFSWDEKQVENFLNRLYYFEGYFICCNFFKKGSDLSFRQQIGLIKKDILENKEIVSAVYNHDKTNDNFFTKLYNTSVRTNNAIIIAAIFKIFYWLKYHFFGIYIQLIPFLKGYKKIQN